jgi:hypothetical protein
MSFGVACASLPAGHTDGPTDACKLTTEGTMLPVATVPLPTMVLRRSTSLVIKEHIEQRKVKTLE